MSKKSHIPSHRILSKVLFSVIAVAVVTTTALTFSQTNNFSANGIGSTNAGLGFQLPKTGNSGADKLKSAYAKRQSLAMQRTLAQITVNDYEQLNKINKPNNGGMAIQKATSYTRTVWDSKGSHEETVQIPQTGNRYVGDLDYNFAKAELNKIAQQVKTNETLIASIDPVTYKINEPGMTIKTAQRTAYIGKDNLKVVPKQYQAKITPIQKKIDTLVLMTAAAPGLIKTGKKTEPQVDAEIKVQAQTIKNDITEIASTIPPAKRNLLTLLNNTADQFSSIFGSIGTNPVADVLQKYNEAADKVDGFIDTMNANLPTGNVTSTTIVSAATAPVTTTPVPTGTETTAPTVVAKSPTVSLKTNMPLPELARLASDQVKILLGDTNNDKIYDNINADLTYTKWLQGTATIYSYLDRLKAFPGTENLFSQLGPDVQTTFLTSNITNFASIMQNKLWIDARTDKNGKMIPLTDAEKKNPGEFEKRYLDIINNREIARNNIITNLQSETEKQANYAKIHDVLGTKDASGSYDPLVSKTAMALYHTFAGSFAKPAGLTAGAVNPNVLTDAGMIRMFQFLGSDPKFITKYMQESPDGVLWGLGADGKYQAVYPDWNSKNPFDNLKNSDGSVTVTGALYTTTQKDNILSGKPAASVTGDGITSAATNLPTINGASGSIFTPSDDNYLATGYITLPDGSFVNRSADINEIRSAFQSALINNVIGNSSYAIAEKQTMITRIANMNLNEEDRNNYIVSLVNALASLDPKTKEEAMNNFGIVKYNRYTTGLAINPKTGQAVYQTNINYRAKDGIVYSIGHLSLDPSSKAVDAQLPIGWGNKTVTLFSDPRTGDVYAEISGGKLIDRLRGDTSIPLASLGNKISIMSVTVSKEGHIGGSFKLFNRLFNYNPNSRSFEYQLIKKPGMDIWVDTTGNVRGSLSLTKEGVNNGTIYFDRTGNIGLSYELKTGVDTKTNTRSTIGTISINKDGQIGGSVDLGKILGGRRGGSFMLGFDKKGITGVNIAMGSIGGKAFGLGVSRDGSLSFGGFIPAPLIGAIPISLGQDPNGNIRVSWPGGSWHILGKENRPLNPPGPEVIKETGSFDATTIFFRHSFKKGFKTVRVYQYPGDKIDQAEQIARGDMIFKVYNELLKRNPGETEFLNWYFYTGHELVKYPEHQQSSEFRMSETERLLRQSITKGPGKQVPDQFRFKNTDEYRWIQAGKDPLNAPTRPQDMLDTNPFKPSLINEAQNDPQNDPTRPQYTPEEDPIVTSDLELTAEETLAQFSQQVITAAKNDPLFTPNR